MFKKTILLVLVFASALFAYSDYCLNQADPCFQENCYKVQGTWEYDPEAGSYDCMYDTTVYSDAEMQAAFSECLDQMDQCESNSYGNTDYTPTSSGPSCCGTSFILLGTLLFVGYVKMKN